MMVDEITYVSERGEAYVRVDMETDEVVDVYWYKKDVDGCPWFDEIAHKTGDNPLFVHAVDPKAAFRVIDRHMQCSEESTPWQS
jgi:hypothetical protein